MQVFTIIFQTENNKKYISAFKCMELTVLPVKFNGQQRTVSVINFFFGAKYKVYRWKPSLVDTEHVINFSSRGNYEKTCS